MKGRCIWKIVIILLNNKLIMQPGTQIYLNDINDLSFQTKHGCIYVIYERDNKKYERVISKQEGIYIDNFSDCDVFTDECDCSQEWLYIQG